MTDARKSVTLRAFLWLIAIAVVSLLVGIADSLIDHLPIWFTDGKHNLIECAVFFAAAGRTIWNWLSRHVWVGALVSAQRGEAK